MSVYERRVTRAGLLKAGAAGAVGLTFARPAFGGLTYRGMGDAGATVKA